MTTSPEATIASAATSRRARTGTIMTAFAVLFLLFDGAARMVGFAPYVDGTIHAGFSAEHGIWIGLLLIVITLLYAVPRTVYVGAILLTGYLGAATATNLRVGDPFIFPLLFGVWVWAALYLRDPMLAVLLSFHKRRTHAGTIPE